MINSPVQFLMDGVPAGNQGQVIADLCRFGTSAINESL